MKKVILTLLLGSLILGNSLSAAETAPTPSSPAGVWIKLIINFHKPKFDCERGFGFCFDIEWGLQEGAPSAPAGCLVRAKIDERKIMVMEIAEADLLAYENGTTLPYFKNQKAIMLDESFTFSEKSSKALGESNRFTIKPGTYPVTYKNGIYTVVFKS